MIERSLLQSSKSGWERWSQKIADWLPYVTLFISTVLGLAQPGQSWEERGGTLGLAVLAGVWVFLIYTLASEPRRAHQGRMAVYLAGLLALATVLMLRQSVFFVFALTGFFHASELRPWPLTVLGIAASSALINTTITGFPWPTIEGWSVFGTIIVIQTLAISFGMLITEKLAQVSEQRRQAVARLKAALDENAGLQAQLLTQAREAGVLEERQRMAREIHDTLAQGLTGIITQLEALEQAIGHDGDWQKYLDNAAQLARASLSEARRSVDASRPEALESAHLHDALAQVAEQWSALNGIDVKIKVTGDPLPLPPEVDVALLRTVQEALANVAKHAYASRAGVTLSYMGDVVMLDVRDDGVGFEPDAHINGHGTGFGLTSMEQRVSRLAGTLAVESEPGGGAAISARIPIVVGQQEPLES